MPSLPSAAPIPLYERYRAAEGLDTGDLSLAAVSYFVAVMIALVVFGRLSNHLGRKAVSIIAITLASAGCLSLLDVTGLAVLATGRALQGLACGLGSSAIAVYIVDLAPEKPHWLAATTAAGAPLIELTIGAIGSGALADYGPAPEQTPYIAVTALLAVSAMLLLAGPEAVTRRPGTFASLRPHVLLQPAILPLLPAAIAVFCGTWALGGLHQSFSPTISAQNLGISSTLIAGIIFAPFMAPYALGGPLSGRLSPLSANRLGIVVLALAVVGIAIGLHSGSVVAVIVCGILAGAAQRTAFTGSMRALLARTTRTERAGIMSTVYVFSYGGATIPSLISGASQRSWTSRRSPSATPPWPSAPPSSSLVFSRPGQHPLNDSLRRNSLMRITIATDATTLTATLGDCAAARDFARMLPLTLTLRYFHSTERIADLPGPLSTLGSPDGASARAGDIMYYSPWGNLAIFYRDFEYAAGAVCPGERSSRARPCRRASKTTRWRTGEAWWCSRTATRC